MEAVPTVWNRALAEEAAHVETSAATRRPDLVPPEAVADLGATIAASDHGWGALLAGAHDAGMARDLATVAGYRMLIALDWMRAGDAALGRHLAALDAFCHAVASARHAVVVPWSDRSPRADARDDMLWTIRAGSGRMTTDVIVGPAVMGAHTWLGPAYTAAHLARGSAAPVQPATIVQGAVRAGGGIPYAICTGGRLRRCGIAGVVWARGLGNEAAMLAALAGVPESDDEIHPGILARHAVARGIGATLLRRP